MIMPRYIDVDKKIEEINMRIESTTKLIENRPYDEEAKLILREHKFCLHELERTPIADVVEAPCKCGECKYSTEGRDWINRVVYKCHRFKITGRDYDDFCSCGERKTENDL